VMCACVSLTQFFVGSLIGVWLVSEYAAEATFHFPGWERAARTRGFPREFTTPEANPFLAPEQD
jgi:hypothetical protein